MSDQNRFDAVTSLEDLFLSREFGRPRVGIASSGQESSLFGATPHRGPLVPMSMAGSTAIGHGTTTHVRRNRAFAAMSGTAAALLIAVGLAASVGNQPKVHLHSALPPTTTPTSGHPVGSQPGAVGGTGSSGTTTSAATGTSGNVAVLTGFSNSGSNGSASASHGTASPTGGVASAPASSSGGGAPAVPTSPASTQPTTGAGDILSPVVNVVGHVVTSTGTTVTGVSTALSNTLPPVAPVTNLVGSVGGTVVDLGDMLSSLSA